MELDYEKKSELKKEIKNTSARNAKNTRNGKWMKRMKKRLI